MYNSNMLTVDKFLLNVLNTSEDVISNLPPRDSKVLRSLAKIINSPIFITENQSKLLVKILDENKSKFEDSLNGLLVNPTWSRPFRQVDKTKRIFLGTNQLGESCIVVEFTYSSSIRKAIFEGTKKISGLTQHTNGKIYYIDLTEKNIVSVLDLLEKFNFEIDEKIQDFYNTIKSWSEIEVKNQFLLTNITHQNFQKSITAELGLETEIDINIIADRSIRYQYFYENSKEIPEKLVEKIAYRKTPKVWIDKNKNNLEEVIGSLIALKRLPVLVVFDHNDHKKCLGELENLSESLEKFGITDNVGIYFRLPNDETGSMFNQLIAKHQYNAVLDKTTKIVGVQHGKIPKFFLKTNWKPMSVLAIGNSLRQTKTAVYANHCDLIISYTDTQPIIESRIQWE
jgi:hypothetical protein